MPSEVEESIWVLVAAGIVTADGFGALRGLVTGMTKKVQHRSRFTRRGRIGATADRTGSRWSLLTQPLEAPVSELPARTGLRVSAQSEWNRQVSDGDTILEARAAQLLRRYGIVTRELLAREPMAPPWNLLARTYRRAEARGEVRGGRFVAGLVGEQFALQEAVDAMRAVHRRELTSEVVRISASDPLNLVGIITPGARVPAVLGNEVLYRDGVPVLRTAIADAEVSA
jgi:ATP-dependent Lhr-like helicase